MQVHLNEKQIEVDTQGLQSFGQLIQKIEKQILEPDGSVITALHLNGRELDAQGEVDHATFPLDRVESLNIRASNKQELALQALSDAIHILPELSLVVDECLQKFDEQSENAGMQVFVTVADGLSWLSTVSHGAETIFQDQIQGSGIEDCAFLSSSRKLQNIARELLNAQQHSDYTTFRDLLEYELKPALNEIAEGIPEFCQSIQA